MLDLDPLLIRIDNALRTIFASAISSRPDPAEDVAEQELTPEEQHLSAGLMRVNHAGEVCAQALYEGQALTARNRDVQAALTEAAREETDHLAWTQERLKELGGRPSLLNPLWYAGSFAIGAAAGLLGDRWNLGFLAETERQVVQHLDGHMQKLPHGDRRSRAILKQMKADEAKHATTALYHGGAELPQAVRLGMSAASQVMKVIARRI